MKESRLDRMKEQVMDRFGNEHGKIIAENMDDEYRELCSLYENQPKAMVNHTHNNIFPVVATMRALIADGMKRPEASKMASDMFLELMHEPERAIQKILKYIPGLYRLMPWIWKTVMPKMFGEDAGFSFKFYPADSRQVKFDMLECPYFNVCKELGCEDLAPTFCTTDDICYGNMHPKLIWNRTKTIARGGDVCDFDLYIKK